MVKDGILVKLPSLEVTTLPSFNSSQDPKNEVENRGLSQKNKNLVKYIFGNYDLVQWWESKAKESSIPYPFEGITGQ